MSPQPSGDIFFWLVVGCRSLAWLATLAREARFGRLLAWLATLAREARFGRSLAWLATLAREARFGRLLAWLATLAREARFCRRRRAKRDDWRKSLRVALNFVLEESFAVARVRSGTTRVPLVRPISRLLGVASSPRRAAFIGCRGHNA